jgi:CRISPR-associated endonuclease Csn1
LIADARLFHDQRPAPVSPWQLRVEGLDRLLAPEEWARAIYHLCKHRGFHWISRAEEKKAGEDAKGEGGKVKQGLAATTKLMREKGYRTAAEMVLAEFPDAQRNKQGDYGKALSRVLLAEEINLLFERQRALGNPHTGEAFQTAILGNGDRKSGLFWLQKPALSGDNLLKMLGHCTFEKAEYRAPKASFTAERHVWLTRLNNLRIAVDGVTRPLNEQAGRTRALRGHRRHRPQPPRNHADARGAFGLRRIRDRHVFHRADAPPQWRVFTVFAAQPRHAHVAVATRTG